MSILIFIHVKNNCFEKFAVFVNFYSFFEATHLFFSKNLGQSKSPIFFRLIEMPSLNSNERIACLECGREYTRIDASRHRKHCDVLKCSNCNFYTYSSKELINHIKKKHCQHNVNLCIQQAQNTLQEKVKLIYF